MKRVLIIGGGSAGMSAARRVIDLGGEAVVFNAGLPVGGTCLHVGCVPSKYLIRAAESAWRAGHAHHPGVAPHGAAIDAAPLLAGARALVRDLREANYEKALAEWENLVFVPHEARVIDPRRVQAGGTTYEGDGILICTGSRSGKPPVPGLAETPHLTNETLFDLERLPESIIVLGGGYIALELAQALHRLGVRVTVLQRSGVVLSHVPHDLGSSLRVALLDEGMDVRVNQRLLRVEGNTTRVKVHTEDGTCSAHALLVATGREGNTAGLGLAELGVALDGHGFVRTEPHFETRLPGVFAAGDVLGGRMFVYTASMEAELAAENLLTGSRRTPDFDPLPWVVFTDPQVAGTGLDEARAAAAGIDVDTVELPVARWPRFRVAGVSHGFLRLIRDRRTDRLVGARAVAPEAGDLMTEISLLIRRGVTIPEILALPYPYLTLSEGIQRCAMRFPQVL